MIQTTLTGDLYCKLNISHGRSKMEGIDSINTDSLSNPYCNTMSKNPATVCYKCYSRNLSKGLFQHMRKPMKENSDYLSKKIPISSLPKVEKKVMRLHSHGELINDNHFINFCNLAKKNENVLFSLWTKRPEIISRHKDLIPSNLILIYSTPNLNADSEIPKHFDKSFTVYTSSYSSWKDIKINCSGKCIDCLKCYNDKNMNIRELIKSDIIAEEKDNGLRSKEALIKRLYNYVGTNGIADLPSLYLAFPKDEKHVIRARLNEAVEKTKENPDFSYPFIRIGRGLYTIRGMPNDILI